MARPGQGHRGGIVRVRPSDGHRDRAGDLSGNAQDLLWAQDQKASLRGRAGAADAAAQDTADLQSGRLFKLAQVQLRAGKQGEVLRPTQATLRLQAKVARLHRQAVQVQKGTGGLVVLPAPVPVDRGGPGRPRPLDVGEGTLDIYHAGDSVFLRVWQRHLPRLRAHGNALLRPAGIDSAQRRAVGAVFDADNSVAGEHIFRAVGLCAVILFGHTAHAEIPGIDISLPPSVLPLQGRLPQDVDDAVDARVRKGKVLVVAVNEASAKQIKGGIGTGHPIQGQGMAVGHDRVPGILVKGQRGITEVHIRIQYNARNAQLKPTALYGDAFTDRPRDLIVGADPSLPH